MYTFAKNNYVVHKGHVKLVERSLGAFELPVCKPVEQRTVANKSRSYPLSWKKISLRLTNEQKKRLSVETLQSMPLEVHPSEENTTGLCQCGFIWEKTDQKLCEGFIYGSRGRTVCSVYYRRCIKHKCEAHFDGNAEGLFNYSGQTIVSYTLLNRYIMFAYIITLNVVPH
jgi:hypothetical protein